MCCFKASIPGSVIQVQKCCLMVMIIVDFMYDSLSTEGATLLQCSALAKVTENERVYSRQVLPLPIIS